MKKKKARDCFTKDQRKLYMRWIKHFQKLRVVEKLSHKFIKRMSIRYTRLNKEPFATAGVRMKLLYVPLKGGE